MGRFKSLLIGNDGEKFSPEGIEEAIVDQSPYIDQAMLYNNQNPYTVGLFVPNISAINQALHKHGLDAGTPEGIRKSAELIRNEVDAYRKGGKYEGMFPERWLPTAIIILPEAFTEHNHLLNSTLKMVRSKITEYFKPEMDYIYNPEAKDIFNEKNISSINKWNNHN
jgi:long-chain acyl-CoA synthetase